MLFYKIEVDFFLRCPLPYRLPSGSSAKPYGRGRQAEFGGMGWDGMGWDGWSKVSFNFFFILRYIKHYTHIYLYTKEKLSGKISCGFIFWSSWRVAPTIFKITLLRRHFSKMSLKVDFLEKNNEDFLLK